MLIIVKVENGCVYRAKPVFQPNKIHYRPKNYITLKPVQSTIGIFDEPHSTPSVWILYCSLCAHMKYF